MKAEFAPHDVEQAAQRAWAAADAYRVGEDPARPKYYACSMLPYPSGRLHMGHVRNYTINDMLARHLRMTGMNVLMPMGWDAFGLPAENAAIKNSVPPARWTRENIAAMKGQMQALGLAIDWSREIALERGATADAPLRRELGGTAAARQDRVEPRDAFVECAARQRLVEDHVAHRRPRRRIGRGAAHGRGQRLEAAPAHPEFAVERLAGQRVEECRWRRHGAATAVAKRPSVPEGAHAVVLLADKTARRIDLVAIDRSELGARGR